jgi:plastocyanin
MSKLWLIIAIVLVIAAGIWFFAKNRSNPTLESSESPNATLTVEEQQEPNAFVNEVKAASNNFNPPTIIVNKGTTVTWTVTSGSVQIASDPHPAHTGLVGFESDELKAGDTYSFTFDKVGSFGYHNHLNPSAIGTVNVEE